MNDVVIVGASAGGLATAESLRRLGFTGTITLVGAEPHLPYDRPPLSKQLLTGAWEPDRLLLREQAEIDALRLDLRLGMPATALDPDARTVTLADGTELTADAVVVATGVRPRRLPASDGLTGVHVLRTVDDALGLRARLVPGRRLVIVGAGFVGAEVASVARALGVEVTLLEAAPVPLAVVVGEQVGSFLAQVHVDHGVDLRAGVTASSILAADGAVRAMTLSDGSVIDADNVLAAIGSVPNTDWLESSGLDLSDGLLCDEHGVAAPGVYGVGDVARWHNPLFGTTVRVEHRTSVAEQGLCVARNLLQPERDEPFTPVPYVWSDQYDMKIQAYGSLRGHDEALLVDGDLTDPASRSFTVSYRTGRRLTGVLAVGASPRGLRGWRSQIAAGAEWDAALAGVAA
jgi:NADPH-dependent 2,4-dienoyl-CoA reductase/sulfur reductase-like enzyme